ncbi:hypothetical protein AAFF_G00396700 [Aldrovandia affinis]|uniref:Uncharacterized protein n=1 Tax=Aldrovandia affinis TaxID=143900 RepID=A0AAD7R4F4_9TELE|nr:hypothetical protein AAFF_G00396700 [Aldrovandia affinis]
MATFLDPRFKTRYMSTEKLEDIKVRAASETEALLVENTALGESPLAEDHTDREKEAATAPQSAKKPKKSVGSLFKKTNSAPASCSQRQITEQELNSYILAMAADQSVSKPNITVECRRNNISLSCSSIRGMK